MIKTDKDGDILWQRVFGEGQYEQVSFSSVAVLPEGGYVFVGYATLNGERYSDMLWFKLMPLGDVIAFTSEQDCNAEIYTMNADGSDIQRLSDTRLGENCPDWSPDGTRLVFASWRDGDGEIYIMDVDGVTPRS